MGPDFNLNIETAAPEQAEGESDIFAAAYERCQRTFGAVNDHTSRGYLIRAGESLLKISQWLPENVDALSEVFLELRQIQG